MKSFYLLLIGAVILFGCAAVDDNGTNNSNGTIIDNEENITSFEDCVNAGYPVMESYPRQCRTAGGKHFVSLDDLFDVSLNASCSMGADCVLVNKELNFRCCWRGACEGLNYSEDKWIGVNSRWFNGMRDAQCPADCGPAPGCPTRAVDVNYTAKCISSQCVKVPLEADQIEEGNGGQMAAPEEINATADQEQNASEALHETEGLLFGNGSYKLVLDDIVLPSCTCKKKSGAFSIYNAANSSLITKLSINEGDSQYWTDPEGQQHRIRVVTLAGGYTGQAVWADVIIYG